MSRLRVFVVVGALLLAACAGEGEPTTAGTPGAAGAGARPTTEPPEPDPTEPGGEAAADPERAPRATPPETTPPEAAAGTPAAIAFEAPLVGGGTFAGGDHDGRDVALWFWAPW